MTWETLQRLLETVDEAPALNMGDPATTLRALEALAQDAPHDRRIAAAVHAVHGAVSAGSLRGTDRAGVRRERLLAWDGWTRTWCGADLESGGEAVLRELVEDGADPVRLRALHRDGLALGPLVSGLRMGDGWLAAPLPGHALAQSPSAEPEVLARLAATALASLARFEAAGMHPLLTPAQRRQTESGVVIVPLDAAHASDAAHVVLPVIERLLPRPLPSEAAIFEVLQGLLLAPPVTVMDAVDAVERALATDLAARRHGIFLRYRQSARVDRAARLLSAVRRLLAALPPPPGRGAIGVDLDGRTLVVERRPGGIWWGPEGEMAPLWTEADGFDAPAARRLLRVRAAAPPNAALQREVDGDLAAVAALGRWIAAGLRSRTVSLLLEKELATTAP